MTPEPDDITFSRSGMGYRLRIASMDTELAIRYLRRSGGEISGQLTVRTAMMGTKTVNGVLHAARFNLSSTAARDKLAGLLGKRTPGIDVDWFDFLERLSQAVLTAEGEGETIAEVGQLPIESTAMRYAITPLCPEEQVSLIYGPGGSCKSLIAQTCALSVAAHREIIPGLAPSLSGPALYLDWETTKEVVNARIQAIAAGQGFDAPRIFYRRCRRPLADDAEDLGAFIAEKGIKFVVIDSAGQAMGAQGEYGDANEGALRLFEAIAYLGAVTTLIVTHVAKAELTIHGNRQRMPYGSVYLTNYARRSFEVRLVDKIQAGEGTDSGGAVVALIDRKSNDFAEVKEIGLHITWTKGERDGQPGTTVFTTTDVTEALRAEGNEPSALSLPQKIIRFLQESGLSITSPQIASYLSEDGEQVRVAMNRLRIRGIVVKDESNERWSLVEGAPDEG